MTEEQRTVIDCTKVMTRDLFPDRPISAAEFRELNRTLNPMPEPEMVKWRLKVTFERVAVYEVTAPAGDEDAAWDVYRAGHARQIEYGEEYESDVGCAATEAA